MKFVVSAYSVLPMKVSNRWDVFVYENHDNKYESISSHATEAEALENLERVRAILRNANCLIDLSVVSNAHKLR